MEIIYCYDLCLTVEAEPSLLFFSPYFNSLLEVREMTWSEKRGKESGREGQQGRETESAGRLAHQ